MADESICSNLLDPVFLLGFVSGATVDRGVVARVVVVRLVVVDRINAEVDGRSVVVVVVVGAVDGLADWISPSAAWGVDRFVQLFHHGFLYTNCLMRVFKTDG